VPEAVPATIQPQPTSDKVDLHLPGAFRYLPESGGTIMASTPEVRFDQGR